MGLCQCEVAVELCTVHTPRPTPVLPALDIRSVPFTGKRTYRGASHYDRMREQHTQGWRDAHRAYAREQAIELLHHRQWMAAELEEFNRRIGEMERERDVLANLFNPLMEVNMSSTVCPSWRGTTIHRSDAPPGVGGSTTTTAARPRSTSTPRPGRHGG